MMSPSGQKTTRPTPITANERRVRLTSLSFQCFFPLFHEFQALVLFETGPRVAAALADLAAGLGGNRKAALCRELTKLHEEIARGELAKLAEAYAGEEPRGEIVLVIAPRPQEAEASLAETETMLREALARHSLKDAVVEVVQATGRSRREVYQRALALTKDQKDGAPR